MTKTQHVVIDNVFESYLCERGDVCCELSGKESDLNIGTIHFLKNLVWRNFYNNSRVIE